jgi:hypothetical protein
MQPGQLHLNTGYPALCRWGKPNHEHSNMAAYAVGPCIPFFKHLAGRRLSTRSVPVGRCWVQVWGRTQAIAACR